MPSPAVHNTFLLNLILHRVKYNMIGQAISEFITGAFAGTVAGLIIARCAIAITYRRPAPAPMQDPHFAHIDVVVAKIINDLPPEIRSSVTRMNTAGAVPSTILYIGNNRLHWKLGPSFVYNTGVVYTTEDGLRHRGNDLPAMVDDNFQRWFRHGYRHRDNYRPAVIRADGSVEFWRNGKQYWPFDVLIDAEPDCA